MQAVIPNKLKIVECSVPENDAPLWDKAKAYKKEERVILNHYIYEAVAENENKNPESNADFQDAPWRFVGPTNQYACLDIYNYTQTQAGEKEKTLTIKVPYTIPATAIGLLNMRAVKATVSVTSTWNEEIFYGKYDLLKDSLHAWDYWFGPFRYQKDLVLTQISPVDGELSITLEHGDRPAIGMIVVGQKVEFGLTQYGARSGFVDYSQQTTNAYGNVTWVKRRTARRASYPVFIHPQDADYVQDALSELSGNPALWIGDNGAGFRSLAVWGFLKEFDDSFKDYGANNANFEVEGII